MSKALDRSWWLRRFPVLHGMHDAATLKFVDHAVQLAAETNLRIMRTDATGHTVRLGRQDVSAHVVCGHILEILHKRGDILACFLRQPKLIHLFVNQAEFEKAGGIMGGVFRLDLGAILLVESRLYEGFSHDWPGVAPFVHEFGHMLDFFDCASGGFAYAEHGLLPGLSAGDGSVFSPAARHDYLQGKALELQRYRALQVANSAARASLPHPIGHPYVFQNNTEFCAGYLELWLRSPNAFARMNPQLFAGYAGLLGWDPRTVWPKDFDFYMRQNAAFYSGTEALWPTRLSVAAT